MREKSGREYTLDKSIASLYQNLNGGKNVKISMHIEYQISYFCIQTEAKKMNKASGEHPKDQKKTKYRKNEKSTQKRTERKSQINSSNINPKRAPPLLRRKNRSDNRHSGPRNHCTPDSVQNSKSD